MNIAGYDKWKLSGPEEQPYGARYTEEELATFHVEGALSSWEQEILTGLIDMDVIDHFPKTLDEAEDACDTVEVIASRLTKKFDITRKSA